MQNFSYTITDENGIHARPAGIFVKKASAFSSEITVTLGDKSASAKKLFALMGLGAKKGSVINVSMRALTKRMRQARLKPF